MLKQTVFLFAVIISLLIIAFISGCDDDRPNGPEEPKDYPVYFCDPAGNPAKLFTFYPIAKRVDSIDIQWKPDIIKVSADGQLLYIYDNNYTIPSFVVRADDLTNVADLPGPVFGVSPDNRFIAISKKGVKILSTSDYSIVFEDSTLPVQSSVFSFDGGSFYSNAYTSVYKVDLTDSNYPITKIDITTEGNIVHVLPSLDETKLFLHVSIHTFIWAFEVYDILADSIIFRDYLVPGYGHMAISPDGEYVFYTNPGRTATDPPSQLPGFKIFNVETNQIERVVVDTNFCRGPGWIAFPSLPVVTPDNRWLVMLGGSFNLSVLYLYDIQYEELVHREEWGGFSHYFIPSLAVQYFR